MEVGSLPGNLKGAPASTLCTGSTLNSFPWLYSRESSSIKIPSDLVDKDIIIVCTVPGSLLVDSGVGMKHR